MENKSTTALVVYGLILGALGYDLYAVWFGGVDKSISQLVTNAIGNYPLVMFICGMLVDHFFGFTMKVGRTTCPACKCVFDVGTGKVIINNGNH